MTDTKEKIYKAVEEMGESDAEWIYKMILWLKDYHEAEENP